ncbi:MAG: CUAEP/CCAEP-tail radical SAM (seleno)protein [Pseudomonadota bacterium]
MRAVLVNPYELGRQPFALAQPAAQLTQAGAQVRTLDLTQQRLDAQALAGADLVAIHLGMHTATRIAVAALPRIRELAPAAHLAAYGLYAPANAAMLRSLGVGTILGGEPEAALVRVAAALRRGEPPETAAIAVEKVDFVTPARESLPPLARYARLVLPDGSRRVCAFADASRGCKHLCRHCPVVPVYGGRFRAVPPEVVLADIRQQVAAGAEHVSFGDPDFLNGPTHALRVVRALNDAFPGITFDATIKIQHLIEHAALLPELARAGCLFVTSAVESVDDAVLEKLDKNHTAADFRRAVGLMREAGIALAPTFVAFTPWTTLEGYIRLLATLAELELVAAVPPVQLAIRLLIPEGSRLLELPGFRQQIAAFDPRSLGYPWVHPDARVDALQAQVHACVAQTDAATPRAEVFTRIWRLAHAAAGRPAPALPAGCAGQPIPHLSEPWYCCAEPTDEQLAGF